jgi:hypothetical protein
MRTMSRILIALLAGAALSACGGGDDGGPPGNGNGGGNTGSAPPATGAPTTAITSDQGSASALANASISGANALVQASSASGLPLGVLVSPPTGLQSTQTTACPYGGSVTTTINMAGTGGITSGDTVQSTYANCAYAAGYVMNGSSQIRYDRWVSATDFAFSVTLTNFTYTYDGRTWGPYSYTGNYAYANGSYSYSYTVNGATIVGQPVVSTSGTNITVNSGTVRTTYGGGWVEWTYQGFTYDSATGRPISGTVTVTGSNGTRAVITVTSTGYTVAITVNGTTTTYTVTRS